MNIKKDKVVSLTYELRVDNNTGEIVETVDLSKPLSFIFGYGQLLPKFESNIDGLVVGDSFEFKLACDEAYGPLNDDAIIELPTNIFEVDGIVDNELLRIGNFVPMRDENGNRLNGKVVNVNNGNVTMDFNHPLAGANLHFSGKITEVRDASEEELEHGHLHGENSCGCGEGDCSSEDCTKDSDSQGSCGCGCGCS